MYSQMFNLACILLILILSIVYYNQEQKKTAKNVLFHRLIQVTIFLTITDTLVALDSVIDMKDFLVTLFMRIHFLGGIVWFYIYVLYCVVYIDNIEESSIVKLIKESKPIKILTIILLPFTITYFFLPFEVPTTVIDGQKVIDYIPGIACLFCFVIYVIEGLYSMIYALAIKKSKDKQIKLLTIIVIAIGSTILILQYIYQDISLYTIALTLICYYMYYTIENPDIAMVNELKEINLDTELQSNHKTEDLINMINSIKPQMNLIVSNSRDLYEYNEDNSNVIKTYLNNISTYSDKLIDNLDNVLTLSHIETEKINLVEQEYLLSELLNDLQNYANQELHNTKIIFDIKINENVPNKLYGDINKIHKVLLNLLITSLNNTIIGKISLNISANNIEDNTELKFKLSDTSNGLNEEEIKNYFINPKNINPRIAYQYSEILHANLTLDSNSLAGNTYNFTINQKIIENSKVELNEETLSSEIKYHDYSNKRVLIVDDNKNNLDIMERLLKPYNCSVTTMRKGEECLNSFKKEEIHDLIILNYQMPELNGIETLHKLQTISKMSDIALPPVVLITANITSGVDEIYKNEGFDDVLLIPINIYELNDIMNKYLNKR